MISNFAVMRAQILPILLLLLTLVSCGNRQEDNEEIEDTQRLFPELIEKPEAFHGLNPDDIDNIYISDLDFDSIPDTFYVIAPVINQSETMAEDECEGPCLTNIFFSNNISSLMIDQSIGGKVSVLDDINENGFRELVFFPDWFQSCWSRMDIFSYNGKEWKLVETLDYNSCEERIITRFEKLEKGLLKVYTNGEKVLEALTDSTETDREISGIVEKIYEVNIP
jgi:hypothetical protein